jgi:hypothetical protein
MVLLLIVRVGYRLPLDLPHFSHPLIVCVPINSKLCNLWHVSIYSNEHSKSSVDAARFTDTVFYDHFEHGLCPGLQGGLAPHPGTALAMLHLIRSK